MGKTGKNMAEHGFQDSGDRVKLFQNYSDTSVNDEYDTNPTISDT